MKTTYVKKMNAVNTAHGAKVTVVRRVMQDGKWTEKTTRYFGVRKASRARLVRALERL